MDNKLFESITQDQKNLTDLPNNKLVEYLDVLSTEHENIKNTIINTTIYLDKLEELYNNILKVYQQRNNGK